MLAGTPFTGYAIPAAALFVLVGGARWWPPSWPTAATRAPSAPRRRRRR
ncbi:MAG: hypothetical protein U0470_06535 [Anaerolineae bacterium]